MITCQCMRKVLDACFIEISYRLVKYSGGQVCRVTPSKPGLRQPIVMVTSILEMDAQGSQPVPSVPYGAAMNGTRRRPRSGIEDGVEVRSSFQEQGYTGGYRQVTLCPQLAKRVGSALTKVPSCPLTFQLGEPSNSIGATEWS